MKKMFKWIINKLVKLIYGKDFSISKPITDSPIVEKSKTKKEIYFEELAENRGRIIELIGRTDKSINEDMVKLAIEEDLKISAIKYNDWKRVYNKIKGFNDPSDELRRLLAQDNLGDRISLQRKHVELEKLHPMNTVIKPRKRKAIKSSDELVKILSEVKENFPEEMGLKEAKEIDEQKLREKDEVLDRILESKNKIIK